MHVMTHLVERDMQRVLRVRTVHYPLIQHQRHSLHARRTDIFFKGTRVRLRMRAYGGGDKEYYERYFSHNRWQRYKNYTIYAKKMQKYLHNSKKSSTFAPAF